MYFKKIFLPIGLLMIGMVWGACVDIPDGPSTNTNPDFRSEVRFINAMPASAGDNVIVDGSSVGSIGFLASTAYANVASGTRSVALGGSPVQTVSFVSEKQASLVFYPAAGALTYLTLYEGDKDKNNGRAGVALLRFINVSDASIEGVAIHSDSATGPLLATAAFGVASGYIEVDPATFQIFAESPLHGVASVPSAAYEDGKVYTFVVAGEGSGMQVLALPDRQIAGPPVGKTTTVGARK
ncbi:MAG: DUF4397 domain-containing protein [Bacteroidota bacterium]